MLYREIIAVCSEIHTKHTSTLCCENAQFLMLRQAVYSHHWAVMCQDQIPSLLVKRRLVKDETCVLSILMFMECSM
jgi:hypothetical protein